mmetsp:Transcript_30336/g.30826  ORF Transcript_30336/g.30826 Transcript_30336/m.30826 type:complete len:540 (+) Transcript_30336:82-1701(+)
MSDRNLSDMEKSHNQDIMIKILSWMYLLRTMKKFQELRIKYQEENRGEKSNPQFYNAVVHSNIRPINAATGVMHHWGIIGKSAAKSSLDKSKDLRTIAATVIQLKWRLWLLKNMSIRNVVTCQSAIRGWIAERKVRVMLDERKKSNLSFDKFCFLLQKELKVAMYSKKYHTYKTRIFKLEDKLRYLIYKTSRFTTRKIDLRMIYRCTKGYSSEVVSPPKHGGRCFSLHLKDERVIDLQVLAESHNGFSVTELVTGFERLIKFMDGDSPFYLITFTTTNAKGERDLQGVPCRAGPSIIKFALDRHVEYSTKDEKKDEITVRSKEKAYSHKGTAPDYERVSEVSSVQDTIRSCEGETLQFHNCCYSKADEQRFYNALHALSLEYNKWTTDAKASKRFNVPINAEQTDKIDALRVQLGLTSTGDLSNGAVSPALSTASGQRLAAHSGTEEPTGRSYRRASLTAAGSSPSGKYRLDQGSTRDKEEDTKMKVRTSRPFMNPFVGTGEGQPRTLEHQSTKKRIEDILMNEEEEEEYIPVNDFKDD